MSKKRPNQLINKPLGVLSTQVLLGLLIALGGGPAGADSSVYVPLEHWVYRFVERLEAQGRAAGRADGIKPYSRQKIIELLDDVDKKYRPELSPIELGELNLLRREFDREHEQALIHYRARGGAVFADVLARQQTDRFSGWGRSAAEVVYRHRGGGIVRGHLGPNVGFRVAFEQVREQGSRHYAYRHDLYERRIDLPQLKGHAADFHEGTAYVKFAVGPVEVQLGKDEALWGPAPEQNLGLGNNAPSFNMIRLQSRFGAVKLVSISAELRPCPNRPDSPLCAGTADSAATYAVNGMVRLLDRQKYLAAHRLEIALTPWLDLGFQEVVVYGDRGLEPSYVNPLMFYWAAQSHLGDKDNLLLGLDLDIHPGRGRRYYLAYLVDDLKKARIFSDDFANKFSLQAGMLWVDPLGWADSELRAEYVRIEPWLYSHRFPINTFRHFDSPLGHALAPNSDQWQLGLTKRAARDVEFAVHVTRSRHGDNELEEDGTIRNVGGDLHYGWRPGDERATKQFLDGHLVQRTVLAAGLNWRILPELQLETQYAQEWGRGVPLPPAWGPATPLARRTGYGAGRQQHLRFDLRLHYF